MGEQSLGGLHEVFLDVEDIQSMREFYTGVLGFEEEFSHEDTMVGLRTGGAALVLRAAERGSSGVQIGFACTGIEALLDELRSKGATVTKPVWEGHWGSKVASIEDPEGNTIHFQEPTVSSEHHRH